MKRNIAHFFLYNSESVKSSSYFLSDNGLSYTTHLENSFMMALCWKDITFKRNELFFHGFDAFIHTNWLKLLQYKCNGIHFNALTRRH